VNRIGVLKKTSCSFRQGHPQEPLENACPIAVLSLKKAAFMVEGEDTQADMDAQLMGEILAYSPAQVCSRESTFLAAAQG
jgi:hypothetical protein